MNVEQWNKSRYASFIREFFARRDIPEDQITRYLRKDKVWHDPMLLKDMDRAIACVTDHVKRKSKIAIFGDYDVDGISSSTLLYFSLRDTYVEIVIPNRHDGYGFSVEAAQRLNDGAYDLVICVDNGTTARAAISALNPTIDVVVLDHHSVGDMSDTVLHFSNVKALVNPQRPDCSYPNKSICAATVAFKFISALPWYIDRPHLKSYGYQLAGLATVADMMSLKDLENRHIVDRGLKEMRSEDRMPFVDGILAVKSMKPWTINTETLGFTFAPIINAVSRMGDVDLAARLVSSEMIGVAREFARHANQHNETRKKTQNSLSATASALLEKQGILPSIQTPRAIFANVDCRHGLLGVISASLSRSYRRPSFVYTADGDTLVGSARYSSGNAINLHSIVSAAAEHAIRFGGHKGAVGFTIRKDKEQDFKDAVENALAAAGYTPDIASASVYDGRIDFVDLNSEFYDILDHLAPYGVESFPAPTLLAKNVWVDMRSVFSFAGSHLKFFALDDYSNVKQVLGWGKASMRDAINAMAESPVDIIYRVDPEPLSEYDLAQASKIIMEDIYATKTAKAF